MYKTYVDEARLDDDIRDSCDSLAQNLVRERERLLQRYALGHDLEQLVVGHDDQNVDLDKRGLG